MADDGTRADLTNWRSSPYNRWAFRNMRDILPTAVVRADPRRTRPLAEAPRSLDGFHLDGPDGATLDLAGFLRATATDALVILHNGAVAFEAYQNGNRAHAPHILMSATKSVTGLLAGILAGRGVLDVDAPVSATLPELTATAYGDARLRDLLDMRAGVALGGEQSRAYQVAANWDPLPPGAVAVGLRGFYEGLPPAGAAQGGPRHDGPFRYVSANTDLLGLVMARATGRTVANLLSELLWQPLGAEDDGFITLDRDGAARTTGGFCATARDLARLGQLVLDGGCRDGVAVIPQDWIDAIADGDPSLGEAWRTGEWGTAFAGRGMHYRSGWYVVGDAPRMLFAMGVHGQNLFVDRGSGMVVAKLSSQAAPIDAAAIALMHRALPVFRRCLARPA